MAASTLVAGMDIRYNPIRRVSESQSEASSIATELSENDIAIRLGLSDSSCLITERFKVDRKKLEDMIQSDSAVTFFDTLMKDTTTHIYWPSHLKVDAKSKKDVHVKILGKLENTKIAKERVLEKLDARGSRVTMKMDISYNDHSSIIGTQGKTIKKIMDDTSTHIHFPDSNKEGKEGKDGKESRGLPRRNNMQQNSNQNTNPYIEGFNNRNNMPFVTKSNQVSLNGTLEGVERARAAVRLASPLSISFEAPGGSEIAKHSIDPYIERIKETFDVKVVSKQIRQKLNATTVMVKGTEKEADKAKEATGMLINYLSNTTWHKTIVCVQMEISTQHHDSIRSSVRQIMAETGTTIILPDCRDGNTPQSKKTHVTIKGLISGVYLARQQLIGNLLITLSFDYSDNCVSNVDIDALNKKYGVMISTRDKHKQNNKSISIKGKEKFIDKLYEARHELLKLTTPLIKAEIPKTYFSQTDLNDEFAFRSTLALMPNRTESPLTHLFMENHFSSQFEAFQNANSPNMARTQHTRQRNPQNNFHSNFLSPIPNMQSRNSNLSPITATSGYNSGHNSFNSSGSSSLDQHTQINLFQQSHSSFLDRDTILAEGSALFEDEKTPTLLDVKNSFNFEQKKIEGYRAMNRAIEGESVRTPTSTWAGLGLSKTSPFSLETVRKSNDWDHNDASPSVSPFGLVQTAGIVDSTPSNSLANYKDIQSLLIHLGLEHYISTFHVHEIDLELFSTLTPENLTTLGIQAFGARKKLLMAIHQLNASKINMSRSTKFSGSAAPGAERRISGDW